jgi:hypothetical protein
MDLIRLIVTDQAVQAVLALTLLAALADLVSGTVAALLSGTFSFAYVGQFVASHLLANVLPLLAMAIVSSGLSHVATGSAANDQAVSLLATGAWAATWAGTLTYLASALDSLKKNVTEGMNRTKGLPGACSAH